MTGKPWDKWLLLVVAVVVIGLSALFAMQALGFADRFEQVSVTPKNELPPTEEAKSTIAKSLVEKTQTWNNPMKGDAPKAVPLFVSIPLIEANGVVIDMLDPNAPLLREPVSNAWLMANNLEFLNAGVLGQDSDSDGFNNLAEWEAKTDPKDPSSHPPYAEKLVFASRQKQDYILRFAARPDPERFQIIRLPSVIWPQRETWLMRIGETSKDQQFRIESFEENQVRNNVGINVDASVLKVTYLPKNEVHDLIRNIDTAIPTYFAEMKFILDPAYKEYIKEGETFSLTADPETKYRVVKVNEDSVIISYQTGSEPEQTLEIPKS